MSNQQNDKQTLVRYIATLSAKVSKVSLDASHRLRKCSPRKKIAKFAITASTIPHEIQDGYQLGVAISN